MKSRPAAEKLQPSLHASKMVAHRCTGRVLWCPKTLQMCRKAKSR